MTEAQEILLQQVTIFSNLYIYTSFEHFTKTLQNLNPSHKYVQNNKFQVNL
jgi:hypothetical protein